MSTVACTCELFHRLRLLDCLALKLCCQLFKKCKKWAKRKGKSEQNLQIYTEIFESNAADWQSVLHIYTRIFFFFFFFGPQLLWNAFHLTAPAGAVIRRVTCCLHSGASGFGPSEINTQRKRNVNNNKIISFFSYIFKIKKYFIFLPQIYLQS